MMNDDVQNQSMTADDLAQQALDEVNDAATSLPASPKKTADVGLALTSLQNVIERNVSELDRIKEELRIQKESLRNVFGNDIDLNDAQDKVTELTQKVKEQKTRLQASPQVNQLKADIGELQQQKKEIEEALSNHLLNLYQITGTKTFDTSDGVQREFSIRAGMKGAKKAA
jgi:hypothetical protein